MSNHNEVLDDLGAPTTFDLLSLTCEIVSAHVGNNAVSAMEVPDLIRNVYGALASFNEAEVAEPVRPEPYAVFRWRLSILSFWPSSRQTR